MIDNKTSIKYLDLVLTKISDVSNFNAHRILNEYLEFDWEKESDERRQWLLNLSSSVQQLGITYNYFKQINGYNNLGLRLTDKGIKAKELGGHFKYENYLKKTPLNTYQKIYLPLFTLFGLLSIYNIISPSVSKTDFQQLNRDFDSLNIQFQSLKKQIEILKEQKPNDSLQAKNFDGLKID